MKPDTNYAAMFKAWKEELEVSGKPNEWEVKQLMRSAGLPVPDEYLLRAEEPISGDPFFNSSPDTDVKFFAVKLCSAEVLHKTDVGGVVLGIAANELSGVLQDLRDRFVGEHLLICPMIPIKGPEFIIGALADPDFGPAVMAGAGGILTELYKDVAFRLAPCSIQEAGYMLDELTISPVLSGYRGSSMDREGLKKILSLFSLLSATAAAEGAQLDINPLVWTGSQWLVLDAKAVI
jgi:hypothetical protein